MNCYDFKPAEVLAHGPSKIVIEKYLWLESGKGMIHSYTVTAKDVLDHFGVLRSIDQLESFGQGICSYSSFILAKKYEECPSNIKDHFTHINLSGGGKFFGKIKEGETIIIFGQEDFCKFRKTRFTGQIYKWDSEQPYNEYFKDYSISDFDSLKLPKDCLHVATVDATVKAIRNSKLE